MSNAKTASSLSTDICCICCDTFTKERRAPVPCPKCSTAFCKECVQKYVLSQEELKGITCMKPDCDCAWTRAFLVQHTTSKFMNKDFRAHKKELLFHHEMSRMQETMPFAEDMKLLDDVQANAKELRAQRAQMRDQLRVVQNKIYRAEQRMWQLRNGGGTENKTTDPARKFIKPCPAEGCNGFLSTHWRCKVCEIQVCAKCHEIKGVIPKGIKPTEAFPEHVCDPGNVATAQMLKKDSKSCPSCGVTIHKTAGCNQMWCTNCNTAFSWRTGKRINGVIHNPHFFEWQRQNNGQVARTPGDVPCGGFPRWRDFRNTLHSSTAIIRGRKDGFQGDATSQRWIDYAILAHYPTLNIVCATCKKMEKSHYGSCAYIMGCGRPYAFCWYDILTQFYRNVAHFHRIEIREYEETRDQVNEGHGNRDLRAKYILGKISAETLKDGATRRDLKNSKEIDIFNVFELMNTTGRESLISIMQEPTLANIEGRFVETYRVMEYCNTELKKISAVYNQSVPIIRYDFYTRTKKFSKKQVFGK